MTMLIILLPLLTAALAVWLLVRRKRSGRPALRPFVVSLLPGLCLYGAVWSAVVRRVVGAGELFAFWSGPGQTAALCACAALCLLLGLTEGGERLRARLDAAADRTGVLWLASFAVTALFFLWSLRVVVMSYMTNDDVFFMQAIARIPELGMDAVTNTLAHSARENTESISLLLCAFLGQLYKLSPHVLWYLGYHLAVLLGSLMVIGRCVLGKCRLRGWPLWAGCAVQAALCAGVFLYSFAVIAFTVTAAVAGTAAVALTLCRGDGRSRGARIAMDAGSAVLLLLCFLQRRATGTVVICFWALAVGYQLLRLAISRGEGWKRRLAALGAAVLVSLALVLGGLNIRVAKSDPAYDEAEYYRSLIGDYLVFELTPEQYERAGIPRELSVLLRGWYFMDERITTDSLRELSEVYYADLAASPSVPVTSRLTAAAGELAAQVAEDPQMLYRTGTAAALLLACAAAFLRFGRKYWPELLTAVCAMGGAGVLLLRVVLDGRFPTRVFLVVAYPAVVTILLMALTAPAERREVGKERRRAATAAAAIAGLAACVFCVLSVFAVPHAAESVGREEVFADQWTVEAYAEEHADTTFITSRYDTNLDPLHPPVYPDNLVLWGAVGDLYRAPEERLYSDAFFRSDVRLLLQSPGHIMFVLQYLSVEHGPVRALDEARLTDAAFVYDIDAAAPADPAYTGWYDWGGMRYYFEDGQAVTGTRVIDGEVCEFAPAGASATPKVVTTEDGTYYTTTAYSLVEG